MNILDISPVIPVVVIADPSGAVPLARALAAGGVGIVEVTLRTSSALESIKRIRAEVPEVVVGAGTVTTPAEVEAASNAGAQFLVSPGTTSPTAEAMLRSGLPSLPGCSTATEVIALRDFGFTQLKFFPAEACGGPAFLSNIAGPLPGLRFCPTGGITLENAPRYLALATVGCVGGSWLAPARAIAEGSWETITRNARAATAALTQA